MRPAPILIAGGGIGGLAAALALSRRGFASIVLERRDDAREVGAGIQLGANAVHALRILGVGKCVALAAAAPECIHVHDGTSGRTLARLPLGTTFTNRHGAPYWTVHRQDLHRALATEATARADITIVTGFDVATVGDTAHGLRVADIASRVQDGAVLIGADGVGSMVRRRLHGPSSLAQAGITATRTVLPTAAAIAPLSPTEVGVWLTPGLHIVAYPVAAGREVALVAIIDESWQAEGWNTPVAHERLLAKLKPLAHPLREALSVARDWHVWALPAPLELPFWSQGQMTLLGDAAHPVLPFLAQGGALALEDAVVLADCIAAQPSDIPSALQRYQSQRMARTVRVQRASSRNGRIYHLDGPARIARDLLLRATPGALLMQQWDWLYGWKPPRD